MKTIYDYDSKSTKEIAMEIANEIAGISNKLATDGFDVSDFKYLKNLSDDLRTVSQVYKREQKPAAPSAKVQQLKHKSFQEDLYHNLKIDSERFDVSYTSKTDDGFYCMMGYARHEMDSKEWAVWISYKERKIVFWQRSKNDDIDSILSTFKKYYDNKGYEISYSTDYKFAY